MTASKDDKVVKDIVKRYGNAIDLKSSPYVIVEIIRQYGPKLGGGIAASCQPPGGPPKVLDPSHIIKELKATVAELNRLSAMLPSDRPRRHNAFEWQILRCHRDLRLHP